MLLTNDWYYFTSAVDKKTCTKIKRLVKDNFKIASVDRQESITDEERKTGRKKDLGIDKKFRISGVGWTNEQWLYDLIWPYMSRANELANWNFDIKYAENIQITRYRLGEFYDWHKDGFSDALSSHKRPDNKFLDGNVRKLSMTILLNNNYEGGEFQFSNSTKNVQEILTPPMKEVGSIIVFPSFMEHRVTPITKGTRYSMVAWFVGPPFK
jgi:PKHD-type hydroxylase